MTYDELDFYEDLVKIVKNNPTNIAILKIINRYTGDYMPLYAVNCPSDEIEDKMYEFLTEKLEVLSDTGKFGFANRDMVQNEIDYLYDYADEIGDIDTLGDLKDNIQDYPDTNTLYYVQNGKWHIPDSIDPIDINDIKSFFNVSDEDWKLILERIEDN